VNKSLLTVSSILLAISGAAKAEEIAIRCSVSHDGKYIEYEIEMNDNRVVINGKN
jgi:hypothetical protein